MRISGLKSWIRDNDLAILFFLAALGWVIYHQHSQGMSYLAIALILLAAVGLLLLLGFFFAKPKEPVILYGDASRSIVKKPITRTNTHPDAGLRLWGELAASLPADCRWIVCGTPALVHPQTGILFGVATGMSYCLRLTDADLEEVSGRKSADLRRQTNEARHVTTAPR